MKQILIPFGLLMAAILGFYWLNMRFPSKQKTEVTNLNNQISFEVAEPVSVGTEKEIKIVTESPEGAVVQLGISFNYEAGMMKVENIELNKEIFDKKAEVKIDESVGKVSISGENIKGREKLVAGKTVLATMKVKGLKKGGAMIYSAMKPVVGVWSGGKVVMGNFEMPNFKLNIL